MWSKKNFLIFFLLRLPAYFFFIYCWRSQGAQRKYPFIIIYFRLLQMRDQLILIVFVQQITIPSTNHISFIKQKKKKKNYKRSWLYSFSNRLVLCLPNISFLIQEFASLNFLVQLQEHFAFQECLETWFKGFFFILLVVKK
jgi:hypothetical protein